MSGQPLRHTVIITNPQGFHLRPITAFAQLAARFESAVQVSREGRTVNGKSPWDMMAMLAPAGSELTVEVSGPDAAAAFQALVELLDSLSAEDLPNSGVP
jgi:phosphotransferase system HPr (HPr) family protein